MNGLDATLGEEADGAAGAGRPDATPAEPQEPLGWVDLSFEHPRADAVERFRRVFAACGIPAVFWCTGLGSWVTVEARLIFGTDGELLRWTGTPGAEWAPLPSETLEGIAGALGVPLRVGGMEVAPPAHAWPKRLEERRLVDTMVVVARDSSVTADLLARDAKVPVVLNRFDKWVVISPLGDPGPLESSNVWSMPDSILLWRQGDERGTSALFNGRQEGHTWGLEIGAVDPSDPWHRDHTGRTVAEWLDLTMPEPPDWEPWAVAADLTPEQAERLRIELRREVSDEQTFPRFADALGLPEVIADLLERDVDPQSIPGAEVVRPAGILSGMWHAIRRDVRDIDSEPEPEPEPEESPARAEWSKLPRLTLWWLRVTYTRPWWYHLLALGAIGTFATVLLVRLQEDGSLWSPGVGLLLALTDYAIPRRLFTADLFPEPSGDGEPPER